MKTKDELLTDLLQWGYELRALWSWKKDEHRAGNKAEYDALCADLDEARKMLGQAANEPRQ